MIFQHSFMGRLYFLSVCTIHQHVLSVTLCYPSHCIFRRCVFQEKFQVRQEPCLLHGLFKLQQTEDWLSDDYILGVIMDLINTCEYIT